MSTHWSGQFITTSAEVTPNGGLVRESPPKWPEIRVRIYNELPRLMLGFKSGTFKNRHNNPCTSEAFWVMLALLDKDRYVLLMKSVEVPWPPVMKHAKHAVLACFSSVISENWHILSGSSWNFGRIESQKRAAQGVVVHHVWKCFCFCEKSLWVIMFGPTCQDLAMLPSALNRIELLQTEKNHGTSSHEFFHRIMFKFQTWWSHLSKWWHILLWSFAILSGWWILPKLGLKPGRFTPHWDWDVVIESS